MPQDNQDEITWQKAAGALYAAHPIVPGCQSHN